MGIPSFYKHLIQTIDGLTSKTAHEKPQFLGLDLNCAIYYCVRKVQQELPYSTSIHIKWEARLIERVIAYIKTLVTNVQPSNTLYIGVDGVAPMAKIRQQRMRRFKSAATAMTEDKIRAEALRVPYLQKERWDTNAITPGTTFMANLAKGLRAYAVSASTAMFQVIVSPADEAGEGEQKIMAYLRKYHHASAVIYGLDADLIMLSLWISSTNNIKIDLYREDIEFGGPGTGGVKENAIGDVEFLYLHINELSRLLFETFREASQIDARQFILDYVALMNLLGNDFVPHGLSLKIRDNGIEKLMTIYKMALPKPFLLKTGESYTYNQDALTALFKILAESEDESILRNCKKKLTSRYGVTNDKTPEGQALARYNDTPLLWAEEKALIETFTIPDYASPGYKLVPQWEKVYDNIAHFGVESSTVTKTYIESLYWTLAYYAGSAVDMEWYYPWPLPPRMKCIQSMFEAQRVSSYPSTLRLPLEPQMQLAIVLPKSSFHLLPEKFKMLPTNYPAYWPEKWDSFSFGRRFMWECEPLIPFIEPSMIREWL